MAIRAFAFTLVLLVALVPTVAATESQVALAATGPSVTDPRYFAGVNVAWFNYACDFGCGQKNGVSSPATNAAVSQGFARLKDAGIHTARWWVFEGDTSAQINRDASGAPNGLNPMVYQDFDAALALADKYDLAYVFVLFSAPTAPPKAWMDDPNQRQRLASTLAPLFERYKDNPRILAWEFINEPEFDVWDGKIALESVQATVKLLAQTVHARTSTAVTVGAATNESTAWWSGLGLDFHSPHWYDDIKPSGFDCARCTDVATIRSRIAADGLPYVVGEFYGGPTVDALATMRDLRANGYTGAWAWSLFYDKTQDAKQVDLKALSAFIADPGGGTRAPIPEATPSGTRATVQMLANWVSPSYTQQGESISIHQELVSTEDANVLLDFEVYDSQGTKVAQAALENQALTAQQRGSFSTTYTVPLSLPPGQYTVKTGAFGPGWAPLLAWSDFAGAFVVEAATGPAPIPSVDMPPPSSDEGA